VVVLWRWWWWRLAAHRAWMKATYEVLLHRADLFPWYKMSVRAAKGCLLALLYVSRSKGVCSYKYCATYLASSVSCAPASIIHSVSGGKLAGKKK
jgi:hypothetical protein